MVRGVGGGTRGEKGVVNGDGKKRTAIIIITSTTAAATTGS